MSYRKYSASQLFTGHELLDDSYVLVMEDTGRVSEIVPRAAAGEGIIHFDGILCPGLVNAHVHLELSHLRGAIPEQTGMTDFLLSVMRQRKQTPERIQAALESAETAMVDQGIVAAGDICNTADSLARKMQRRIHYFNFIEVMGFQPQVAPERLQQGVELLGLFEKALPGNNALVPHAPYSVSPDLLRNIISSSLRPLLSVHNQESADESAFLRTGQGPLVRLMEFLGIQLDGYRPPGKDGLAYLLPFFSAHHHLILVHNVNTAAADIEWLKSRVNGLPGLFFCVCPRANRYVGNGLPDIPLLMQSGYPLVVGTDSLASNASLDLLAELREIRNAYPHIPVAELLKWATLNGARALQMQDSLGSFEPGKKPGVVYCLADLSSSRRLM